MRADSQTLAGMALDVPGVAPVTFPIRLAAAEGAYPPAVAICSPGGGERGGTIAAQRAG